MINIKTNIINSVTLASTLLIYSNICHANGLGKDLAALGYLLIASWVITTLFIIMSISISNKKLAIFTIHLYLFIIYFYLLVGTDLFYSNFVVIFAYPLVSSITILIFVYFRRLIIKNDETS